MRYSARRKCPWATQLTSAAPGDLVPRPEGEKWISPFLVGWRIKSKRLKWNKELKLRLKLNILFPQHVQGGRISFFKTFTTHSPWVHLCFLSFLPFPSVNLRNKSNKTDHFTSEDAVRSCNFPCSSYYNTLWSTFVNLSSIANSDFFYYRLIYCRDESVCYKHSCNKASDHLNVTHTRFSKSNFCRRMSGSVTPAY